MPETCGRKKQGGSCGWAGELDNRCTRGAYADVSKSLRDVGASTHAHASRACTQADMFSIPLFIRVRRLRDPLSVPGNNRHERIPPPVHPHTESPDGSHCRRPLTCVMHLHVHVTRVVICGTRAAARYYQWVRVASSLLVSFPRIRIFIFTSKSHGTHEYLFEIHLRIIVPRRVSRMAKMYADDSLIDTHTHTRTHI